MDRSGGNSLRPDSPFSFQRLLFEDDWHRWDTYSTVNANVVSPDPTAVVYLDTPTMMPDYRMTLSLEDWECWLQRQSSTNEQSETASQEEFDIHPDILTPEELEFVVEDMEDVSTVLKVEAIDKNIRRGRYESDEKKKCMICLYKLKYSEETSKLECGHAFHFECIQRWLMVKNQCPLCKQKAV